MFCSDIDRCYLCPEVATGPSPDVFNEPQDKDLGLKGREADLTSSHLLRAKNESAQLRRATIGPTFALLVRGCTSCNASSSW